MAGTHAVPTPKDLDMLVLRLFKLKAPKANVQTILQFKLFKGTKSGNDIS